jgi:hypothetical protein
VLLHAILLLHTLSLWRLSLWRLPLRHPGFGRGKDAEERQHNDSFRHWSNPPSCCDLRRVSRIRLHGA